MIFVSVGSRYPFDRLISAVDGWAENNPDADVFVQCGESKLSISNCRFSKFLTAPEFKKAVMRCSLVISHAGMGNIITALEFNKPIVVVPRLPSYGEVVNDHQVSTVRSLEGRSGILVLEDVANIDFMIKKGLSFGSEKLAKLNGASPELIEGIRSFINS